MIRFPASGRSRVFAKTSCLSRNLHFDSSKCRTGYTTSFAHFRPSRRTTGGVTVARLPWSSKESTLGISVNTPFHRTLSTEHTTPIGPSALQAATSTEPILEPYSPPRSGILAILPKSWVPYAELIRLDKPTGTYYLFFPCLFSTLLAAPLATPIADPVSVLSYSALFFTGALVMRGCGCTINDLWDRDFDPNVARTRLRPIARRAITPRKAVIFTGGQLAVGLAVLLQFPMQCWYIGALSLPLVITYPLAKRFTHYPQAVLGLAFSWGAFMGFPALGIDLFADSTALMAALCLYASNISWTVLYDMIYAHMDIKDDAKAGIKSIALRHEKETKAVLTGLAVAQIGLLATAGVVTGAGPAFFIGSCGLGSISLATMIYKVNLKSVADCWWWFKNGCWLTGGAIASGLAVDYAMRLNEPDVTLDEAPQAIL